MDSADPLDDMKDQVVRIRAYANLQEKLLELHISSGLPEHHAAFVRAAISMGRTAAAALDQAIDWHIASLLALGQAKPTLRPKLKIVKN